MTRRRVTDFLRVIVITFMTWSLHVGGNLAIAKTPDPSATTYYLYTRINTGKRSPTDILREERDAR